MKSQNGAAMLWLVTSSVMATVTPWPASPESSLTVAGAVDALGDRRADWQ